MKQNFFSHFALFSLFLLLFTSEISAKNKAKSVNFTKVEYLAKKDCIRLDRHYTKVSYRDKNDISSITACRKWLSAAENKRSSDIPYATGYLAYHLMGYDWIQAQKYNDQAKGMVANISNALLKEQLRFFVNVIDIMLLIEKNKESEALKVFTKIESLLLYDLSALGVKLYLSSYFNDYDNAFEYYKQYVLYNHSWNSFALITSAAIQKKDWDKAYEILDYMENWALRPTMISKVNSSWPLSQLDIIKSSRAKKNKKGYPVVTVTFTQLSEVAALKANIFNVKSEPDRAIQVLKPYLKGRVSTTVYLEMATAYFEKKDYLNAYRYIKAVQGRVRDKKREAFIRLSIAKLRKEKLNTQIWSERYTRAESIAYFPVNISKKDLMEKAIFKLSFFMGLHVDSRIKRAGLFSSFGSKIKKRKDRMDVVEIQYSSRINIPQNHNRRIALYKAAGLALKKKKSHFALIDQESYKTHVRKTQYGTVTADYDKSKTSRLLIQFMNRPKKSMIAFNAQEIIDYLMPRLEPKKYAKFMKKKHREEEKRRKKEAKKRAKKK